MTPMRPERDGQMAETAPLLLLQRYRFHGDRFEAVWPAGARLGLVTRAFRFPMFRGLTQPLLIFPSI